MSKTISDNQDYNQNSGTVSESGFGVSSQTKKKTMIEGDDEVSVIGSRNPNLLVGFLVSYSRMENGEYWELREGRNVIGSASSSDIQLNDKTTSSHHATMVVRRSGNDNRLMYILTDENSSNGVRVNGIDIETEKYQCKNFDKIKIGGYELLVVTIDKMAHGLVRNEKLQESKSSTSDYSSRDYFPMNDEGSRKTY
jgi:predicted component of type VI protein secretion system